MTKSRPIPLWCLLCGVYIGRVETWCAVSEAVCTPCWESAHATVVAVATWIHNGPTEWAKDPPKAMPSSWIHGARSRGYIYLLQKHRTR